MQAAWNCVAVERPGHKGENLKVGVNARKRDCCINAFARRSIDDQQLRTGDRRCLGGPNFKHVSRSFIGLAGTGGAIPHLPEGVLQIVVVFNAVLGHYPTIGWRGVTGQSRAYCEGMNTATCFARLWAMNWVEKEYEREMAIEKDSGPLLAAVLFLVAFEICQRRFTGCPCLLDSLPPFGTCHVGSRLASTKDVAGSGKICAIESVSLFARHGI